MPGRPSTSLGVWHIVHVHRTVDSKGIAELHLLLLRWHRRDASMCPSSKRLLSVPVAPLACHTVARTEVNFDLGVRYVAWVGGGKKYVK